MNNTPTVTPYKKGGVLSLVIGHCWVFFCEVGLVHVEPRVPPTRGVIAGVLFTLKILVTSNAPHVNSLCSSHSLLSWS